MTGAAERIRKLWVRAAGRHGLRLDLGLGLAVAVTLLAAFWMAFDLGRRLDSAVTDTALAGQQEMLVQRIALKAAQLALDPAQTQLSQAVAAFDHTNRQLSAGADATPRLIHLYFESGTLSLTALSRQYLELARQVLDEPAQTPLSTLDGIAQMSSVDLMVQQNEATEAFEAHAAELAVSQSRLMAAAAALLAALAAIEAALIALPLRHALADAEAQAGRDDAEIAHLGEALSIARGEVMQLTDRLVEVGWTDTLTGLMNRGHFHMRLEAEVGRATTEAQPMGVIAIAIDDFRAINESLGHAAGDTLLRRLADRLRTAAPAGAALARTDGNGFALAARFADEAALVTAAKVLAAALARPTVIAGRELRVAVRLGAAFQSPAEPAERLLSNADIALGHLRKHGAARVLAFTPRMRADLEEREALVEDLRGAIETRAFRALYQPQVGLGGTGLCGFEVLARWPHPVHGLLPPERFLRAAEETGLVDAIDAIVLEDALTTLGILRGEGLAIPRLSINASVKSLLGPGYAAGLSDSVRAAGLKPTDITVEIAEARLRDLDEGRAQEALNHLRWAGFGLEIDGFGTGLAALSTLSRMPVTGVKLDRALVAALPDSGAESVLRSLTGLARDLDLRVVAEGVQSSTSLGFLASIGVQAVQGFGISRPLDTADVRSWMGAGGDRTSVA